MITRRVIPEKLLVIPVEEQKGAIINIDKAVRTFDAKVQLAGRAPEGEIQIEDGQIIKVDKGGQPVNIDGVEMLLINYSQILYIY